mmetsp:Transcript_26309/g.84158  ORF Transcript_26309/g.84158 Transcript_26309/m.84158 type:complete len:279 (+) Transcript_26309:1528-2364(+)
MDKGKGKAPMGDQGAPLSDEELARLIQAEMAGADAAWVEPKSDCPHTASIRWVGEVTKMVWRLGLCACPPPLSARTPPPPRPTSPGLPRGPRPPHVVHVRRPPLRAPLGRPRTAVVVVLTSPGPGGRLDVDIPPPDASCESCGDVSESWTCMQCMQASTPHTHTHPCKMSEPCAAGAALPDHDPPATALPHCGPQVLCGRYVAGHMKAHCEGSGEHHIACSYRDLSFWCFACDSYVDPYGQPVMREAFAKVHQQKFGEPAVMPPPRTPGWGAPTLELQ